MPFHNPYLQNKGNSLNHFTSNLSNPTQPRCFFSTCIPLAVAMGHPSSPRIIAWPSTSFLFNRRHPSRRQNGCQELVGVCPFKNTNYNSKCWNMYMSSCLLISLFIFHTNTVTMNSYELIKIWSNYLTWMVWDWFMRMSFYISIGLANLRICPAGRT